MLISIASEVYESNPPQYKIYEDTGESAMITADALWKRLTEQGFRGGDWTPTQLFRIKPDTADGTAFRNYIQSIEPDPDKLVIQNLPPEHRANATIYISKCAGIRHHVFGQRRLFETMPGDEFPLLGWNECRRVQSVRCTHDVRHAALVVDGVAVADLHFGGNINECLVQYTQIVASSAVHISCDVPNAVFTVEVFDETVCGTGTNARIAQLYTYATGLGTIAFGRSECVLSLWVRRADGGPPDPGAVVRIDDQPFGPLSTFLPDPENMGWLRRDVCKGPCAMYCRTISVDGAASYELRCQHLRCVSIQAHCFGSPFN